MRDALDFDAGIDTASALNAVGVKIDKEVSQGIENRLMNYPINSRANVIKEALRMTGITNLAIAGLSTDQGVDEIFVGVIRQSHVVGGIRCNGKGIVLETLSQMLTDTTHGQVTFFNVSSQEHARQVAISEIGFDGFQSAVTDVAEILTNRGIES